MGLVDIPKVEAQLLEPALDKIKNETIPTAQRAGQAIVDSAVAQLSNVLQGALLSLAADEDKALTSVAPILAMAAEIQKLLAKLNAGGSITITVHL